MRSKKQSDTSKRRRQPSCCFFLDRNLGSVDLPDRLRGQGVRIEIHDDFYQQKARDPWIFYECGKKGWIVVTSDKEFMKSFPHMAAIALGKTMVFAFSHNNYNSKVRSEAFITARPAIDRIIRGNRGKSLIATVGMTGTVSINNLNPRPTRKSCDPADWQSYVDVCRAEGIRAEMPTQLKLKNG